MWVIERHSSTLAKTGQTAPRPRLVSACAVLLLLFAVGFTGSGCNSIYHRTLARLPLESAAELKLCLADAREAERSLEQAVSKLRDHLDRGAAGEIIQTDFDRVVVAAYELERCGLAARDVALRMSGPMDQTKEIEHFQAQATAWLGYVRSNRDADATTQARRLEAAIRGLRSP